MSMLNDWISKHVRMPEKEDLDKRGRVIVWNEFSGADMMGMHELKNLGSHVSHWMRVPERPGVANGWTGCVMIWNDISDAAFVTAVDNVRNYGTHISHWRSLPVKPEIA